ncbi:phycobilisome rod-core linker polypeptide [Synechococcus sp. LTW-R]|uniref:phycobilisome rod-core linker polypeptide n=1 Tax=Synechococcus sp. LTW-R TaxID=2751170 RepID=UPI001624501D|nr:phycobilisome rod-core linker polypeptide [Synechococcus sp. LTW-R]QNG28784.1 phycobilisome rod-core linker polypeptide [Synechococcus sp. LTW-R]
MTTATLTCPANQDRSQADDVLRAAYRQVFGNRYLMELDVQPSIEALFMNGDLTVQGLVTALAQSETYRRLYLETNSPYRFVELNFKHLLGRPPRDQAEVSEHVRRLADQGFEAEIASYIYSDEYLNNFGIDGVPFARTATSVVGESTLAYQRTQAMDPGYAGFDTNGASVLQTSVASSTNPTAAGARKVVGGGERFTISWTSRLQLGSVRRSAQRSVVSYGSLSKTIQSIQAQGGRILFIANA